MRTVTDTADNAGSHRKRGIVANTTMNAAAQFASLISTLVFFPLLVRAFGVVEYGVYIIALSVIGMAAMFDFGVGASTVRLVARHVSLDDAESFRKTVSSAAGLLLVLGIVVAAVIAVIAVVASDLFRVSSGQADLLRTLLLVGAAGQLWYWPTTVGAHVLAGMERYDIVARTSIISTIANVVGIGIVLLAGAGPVTLMSLGVATMMGGSLLNILALFRLRPAGSLASLPSRPVAMELFSGGLPIFVASIAQFFNREQVDRLVIGIFIGPAAVVVYEVAAKLSMLVGQFTGLSTSALLPVASGMAAREDAESLRTLFIRGGRYVSLGVAPIALALIVVAEPFVLAWFGADFKGSIIVAQVLVLAQLFVPLYQTGDAILIGKGRFSAWVPRGLGLALLNIGLSLVLVRQYGIVGVAVGTLVAGLLELPLYAQLALKETGATVRQWIGGALAAYLLLPVVALVVWIARATDLTGSLLGVATSVALSVGVYWLVAYGLVLTSAERTSLGTRLRRLVPHREGV
jgi:O-antigen/teichoic acid export membrane protein